MNLIATQWLTFAGLASSLLICCVFWVTYRQQQRRLTQLEDTLKSLQQCLEITSDSGIGVGRKVVSMERRLQAAELKQKEIESSDLQKVSYNEAVRLLGMGADVEDLVGSCGLTRAEANLLNSLHTSQPKFQAKNR